MDDNAILDLFRERSEDAIVQVQIKYGNYCRSIAYGILSSEEDSEECVNDTYMRAWNSIPPHIPERLSAYLGKITRNLSIDRLRRKGTGKRGGGQFEVALSELEECLPSPSAAGTAFSALFRLKRERFLSRGIGTCAAYPILHRSCAHPRQR